MGLLVFLGACSPAASGNGGPGSGGAGSGGVGSGGSGSGGSGSGGSASGGSGSGGSGSGGSASGGAGSGGSGSGGAGSGGAGSGGSGTPASFQFVKDVITFAPCGGPSCHGAGENPPAIYAEKDDDAKLYALLTTFKSTMCGNRVLIKPGEPDESAFYLVQAGKCGKLDRMPKGCVDNCTSPDDLAVIRQWILDGAKMK